MCDENKSLRAELDVVKKQNLNLVDNYNSLKRSLIRNQIQINGIENNNKEPVSQTIKEFVSQQLHVEIGDHDINHCYSVGKQRRTKVIALNCWEKSWKY